MNAADAALATVSAKQPTALGLGASFLGFLASTFAMSALMVLLAQG